MKKLPALVVSAAVVILAAFVVYDHLFSRSESLDFFAMDTLVSVETVGFNAKKAAREAEEEINRLDKDFLSKTSEGSEICSLNRSHGGKVSDEANELLTEIKKIEELSGGAFRADLGSLIALWGIGTDDPRVPPEEEIEKVLSDTGKWTIDDKMLTLSGDAKLDLGAAGKGYACDKARETAIKYNCRETVAAVGGSVLVYSSDKKKEFSIGIRNPEGETNDVCVKLTLPSCCVSTSGGYERRFTAPDGKTYHHIFDPSTGYSAESGLKSVTVVSQSGLYSDILSTVCFVLGEEKSLPLLEKYDCQAVFIRNDNTVRATSGLSDKMTVVSDDFTEAQ